MISPWATLSHFETRLHPSSNGPTHLLSVIASSRLRAYARIGAVSCASLVGIPPHVFIRVAETTRLDVRPRASLAPRLAHRRLCLLALCFVGDSNVSSWASLCTVSGLQILALLADARIAAVSCASLVGIPPHVFIRVAETARLDVR